MLNSSSLFKCVNDKLTIEVSNSTASYNQNKKQIILPIASYEDGDTDLFITSALNNFQILSIPRHSGEIQLNQGVALHSCNMRGEGSSRGDISFKIYELK